MLLMIICFGIAVGTMLTVSLGVLAILEVAFAATETRRPSYHAHPAGGRTQGRVARPVGAEERARADRRRTLSI